MLQGSSLRAFALLAALFGSGEALAQAAACQRYRAELASFDRGGGSAEAASQARAEIARLAGYSRSIGCDHGGGFFFGGPPECGAINQRLRAMEASYARLAGEAEVSRGQNEARRSQLRAAMNAACAVAREADLDRQRRARQAEEDEDERPRRARKDDDERETARATGGSRTVCVRTCDGYAFPLTNMPDGRESADDLCKALCPGAETAAYSAPGGDDALEQAVSLKSRKPYVRLANAFKFQKKFDPSCACKKDGQNWAQVLQRAERMIERRRGDILVTVQKAEEMSRPKVKLTSLKLRAKAKESAALAQQDIPTGSVTPRPAPAEATPESQAAGASGAAAPTAGSASSGIDPKTGEAPKVVAEGEGQKREVAAQDGRKQTVRVIAPDVVPVPQTQRP